MHYGVVFPQTEFGNDIQAIKDYAQTAEASAMTICSSTTMCSERIRTGSRSLQGRTYEHPFHEPMVFFGFLAAITTRLGLVTGILILPQRQTALVAKQTAEVDVLSGGVCVLALGLAGITSSTTRSARISDARAPGRRANRSAAQALDAAAGDAQECAPRYRQCRAESVATASHPHLVRWCCRARAQALHGSVTGGCRVGGHRMTGPKSTSSRSMAISKRPAAIAKILVLIRGSAFRA